MTISTHELEFKKAKKYLSKIDPVLAKTIALVNLEYRKPHSRHFEELASSIISQQLSVKAAATIEKRFRQLFGKNSFPKPAEIIKMPDAKIRSCGLSNSKVSFIKDLATRVEDGRLHFKGVSKMTDEEIIEMLVAVKGIGRWTAEMFLMFSLVRPDVFSHGDLGLRNAMKKMYKIRGELTLKKAEKIAEKWKPYRTLACRYLWASLDLK